MKTRVQRYFDPLEGDPVRGMLDTLGIIDPDPRLVEALKELADSAQDEGAEQDFGRAVDSLGLDEQDERSAQVAGQSLSECLRALRELSQGPRPD